MYIFNGKGWHTLGDINGTPRRIFFDGSKVYYASGQNVSFDDIESLDTGNLERQVETGSLSYQQTADLETIRFDGGFAERPGTAYRLRIRANDITSTEKITILFKSDTVSAYTAIITDNVFDEVQPTREFVLGPNGEGIAFKWIQLKFTLERDAGDDTLTPDMISATLEYEKLPKGLERFEFEVSETATMKDFGGGQRNIDNELFTLQDGETTQLLQHLVFAGKDTYVRVLGVSVVEALVEPGVGGGPAASQTTDGRYTVVCEERAT